VSDQTPPTAAPETPAPAPQAPQTPPRTEPASVTIQRTRRSHIDRAMERARASTGTPPTPPAAPVDPAAPTEPPRPNAALAALGGAPAPAAPAPTEPAIDATDARVVDSMTKILELERAARAEREQIERDRQALAAEREPLTAWKQAAELKAAGKPLQALQALGLTYEELTVALMKGEGAAGGLEPATQQLMELQRQLEEMPKTFEEKIRAAHEEAVTAKVEAYKASVQSGLKSDPERWGLLTDPVATDGKPAIELVELTMQHAYEADGTVLTWQDAADMLEAQLESRARDAALSPSSKLARLFRLSTTAAPIAPTSQPPTTTEPSRSPIPAGSTLTPALASQTTAGTPQPRTADDFRRRALDAARQRRNK